MTGTTETSLAARLARLTPAQRALLDARVRDLRRATPSLDRIPKRRRPNRNRLTVDQERIWLIHQFDPTDPVYNVFLGWRLRGDLDVSALERAVNAVVARHEALRTTFEVEDLRPVQVIHDEMPITFRRLDLRALPEAEREPEMVRLATEEIRRPIDITRGPLLRVALIRLAEREHVLRLHHAPHRLGRLVDGRLDRASWPRSTPRSRRRRAPAARAGGPVRRLRRLAARAGCAGRCWTRSCRTGREQLAGAPAAAGAAHRPAAPAGADVHAAPASPFRLRAALTAALRGAGRAEGATLFMTLLAGSRLLLAALHRAGRHRRRHARRRPQPAPRSRR